MLCQHNGPGGDQEVWHYQLHRFPRTRDDRLYELTQQRRTTTPAEQRQTAGRACYNPAADNPS